MAHGGVEPVGCGTSGGVAYNLNKVYCWEGFIIFVSLQVNFNQWIIWITDSIKAQLGFLILGEKLSIS